MEQTLLDTIHLFALEIQRLENHRVGSGVTLTISVAGPNRYDVSGTPPKISLTCQFYDGKNYNTVEAGSLDSLMNEVARRTGFIDRQVMAVEAIERTLTALPTPNN